MKATLGICYDICLWGSVGRPGSLIIKIYETILVAVFELVKRFLKKIPSKGVSLDRRRSHEEELDLEEVDLIQEIDTFGPRGAKKNQAIKQVAKQYGLQREWNSNNSSKTRKGWKQDGN